MRALILALSALIATAGCAAGRALPGADLPGQLPAIAALDGIKAGSAVFHHGQTWHGSR